MKKIDRFNEEDKYNKCIHYKRTHNIIVEKQIQQTNNNQNNNNDKVMF